MTLANQRRDVAAADDSVSLCQVRENDYKAVNRLVHERARKSAISHWHGESQPSIAPLVRLVYSFDTFCCLFKLGGNVSFVASVRTGTRTEAPRDWNSERGVCLTCQAADRFVNAS